MTSEVYCRQNSKSSGETEYTNDESNNEKTLEDLREDVAQLEHVNSNIQKQLTSCQKEAEETIDSLHQQIRNLQLDRDEKERTNAQLQKRLKFLTEYKVETGTQTTEVISPPRHKRCHKNRSLDSERDVSDDEDQVQDDVNHRILILGDSHGRHIAQLLAEDLGPKFSVSGVLKPHASLEQVTSNIDGLARGFDKSDFIAVVVGDSHVDVVTYLWGLLAAASTTNLLLGLVPVRVDNQDESPQTLVLVNGSHGNEGGSAYLIPIRRDRPGSLGRGAKKELSAKMADVILKVLGDKTNNSMTKLSN